MTLIFFFFSARFGGELFRDHVLAPELLRGDNTLPCVPMSYTGASTGVCVESRREFGAGGEGERGAAGRFPRTERCFVLFFDATKLRAPRKMKTAHGVRANKVGRGGGENKKGKGKGRAQQ